jgi:hypothetical protein
MIRPLLVGVVILARGGGPMIVEYNSACTEREAALGIRQYLRRECETALALSGKAVASPRRSG